jgi:hypothetical protein
MGVEILDGSVINATDSLISLITALLKKLKVNTNVE